MRSRRRIVALLAAALAALGTAGGIAAARARSAQPPTVTTQVQTPAAAQRAGADSDHLNQQDQNASEAVGEQESEKAGEQESDKEVEERGEENLPGGGHADPEGQDVQHEFQGVE